MVKRKSEASEGASKKTPKTAKKPKYEVRSPFRSSKNMHQTHSDGLRSRKKRRQKFLLLVQAKLNSQFQNPKEKRKQTRCVVFYAFLHA